MTEPATIMESVVPISRLPPVTVPPKNPAPPVVAIRSNDKVPASKLAPALLTVPSDAVPPTFSVSAPPATSDGTLSEAAAMARSAPATAEVRATGPVASTAMSVPASTVPPMIVPPAR
ncbi:hypothetical protein NOLU111490_14880 [Novosphingobium lubricantis]